jgi:signal peptidase II
MTAAHSMSSSSPSKRFYLFLTAIISIGTVCVDQASKLLVLRSFQPGEVRPVIDGLFNLTLTFNRGAAFGLWSWLSPGIRELVLGLTVLIAMAVVVYFLSRPYYQNVLSQSALALIMGGAIGNIMDRVRIGAVVDFLDVYYGTYHWPAFNVADSAICIGVGFLIIFSKPIPAPNRP